ncbi:MAG: hypothetical protein HY812_09775 [Planctomycetes bacterium]|nr:hypothetical protein [Planctomycetota bacterium]
MRCLPLAFCCLALGCAAYCPPREVAATLNQAVHAAQIQIERENPLAAAQLVEAVLRIDPEHASARQVKESISSPQVEFLFEQSPIGSNRARRVPIERSLGARIGLYLPDRLLDLLDVLSFDVHLGLGVLVNVHVTRAVQVGAGGRATGGFGWHDHRSLGVLAQTESEFVLPGVGAQAYLGALAGTSGLLATGDALAGVHAPSAELYQEYRDYWAVGVSVTAVVVGLDLDIHPLEIADFAAGLCTFDFLYDDLAATTGLGLSHTERALLWQLSDIGRSQRTMEAYLATVEAERGK